MKVLLTLDFPPQKGGIQNFLYYNVKHTFTESDVVIIGGQKKVTLSELNAHLFYCNTPVDFLNKKISLFLMLITFLKMRLNSNDIVECANVYTALIPWLIGFLKPSKYGVYIYGTELLDVSKNTIKGFILRSVLNRANKIYSISKFSASLLPVLSKPVQLIYRHPKIELSDYCIKSSGESDKEKCLNIVSIGRLVKHKGFDIIIKSLKKIITDKIIKLTIVGSGPEKENLETLVSNENLSHSVKIVTDISDSVKNKILAESDMLILASISTKTGVEGFGIVLLEAMVNKIPVIASNSGGIPEVLDYGRCGILFKEGSSDELAAAISNLVIDSELKESIINQAYERACNRYVW